MSTGKATAAGQVPTKVKSLVLSMYSLYRRPPLTYLTSQFLKESRSIT